jgi:hypothetical protein
MIIVILVAVSDLITANGVASRWTVASANLSDAERIVNIAAGARASASALPKFVVGSARKRAGPGWKSTRRRMPQAARGLQKATTNHSAWMIRTDEDPMIAPHLAARRRKQRT